MRIAPETMLRKSSLQVQAHQSPASPEPPTQVVGSFSVHRHRRVIGQIQATNLRGQNQT